MDKSRRQFLKAAVAVPIVAVAGIGVATRDRRIDAALVRQAFDSLYLASHPPVMTSGYMRVEHVEDMIQWSTISYRDVWS